MCMLMLHNAKVALIHEMLMLMLLVLFICFKSSCVMCFYAKADLILLTIVLHVE